MSKIGIFYGPELGSVEKVARVIESKFGADKVELVAVKNANETALQQFDKLIFGMSTIGKTNWDSEHKDTDWDEFVSNFDKVNWSGKKIAMYGLGDHVQYPQHFVDALGWMYERLENTAAELVGFCSTDGYTYEESEGIKDGLFLGLPVDEDNESDKTDSRVENWINRLINECGF
ncbi:flavodoxin [Carboxylicivirga sp. A043]|uniref:flavodoxin n=1 Tax=Carboxylicivirga litoralis TaxID=2816963 RepID=UPI0021CB38F2|nr:flavodoxin [Carboxylicivirga sp. A043]MCU4156152.1 flavodoxin [Carboxylicivirga sp. A043]